MSHYTVEAITAFSGLAELEPEWLQLFDAAGVSDPFVHPAWLKTWAHHFLQPSQLYVLSVRGANGELVGVGPFFRRQYGHLPGRGITSIELMGGGHDEGLTELVEVLSKPALQRQVLRACIQFLMERPEEWDWIELVVPPDPGWLDPSYLPDSPLGRHSFILHKGTRPCTMLALPDSWDELHRRLKQHVKGSLRRGECSIRQAGYAPTFTFADDAGTFAAAMRDLYHLHHARARLHGKISHFDYVEDRGNATFLEDVAFQMFSAGLLTPCVMRIGDGAVAARLLMHVHGALFFSISGFDPEWWDYNVATTLVAESLRFGIRRGLTVANLSSGVDRSKSRWGGDLQLYQEFLIVGPRRRSVLAFSLYWQLRAARLVLRERKRHERVE